jgi:hypothetical protein
VQDIVPDAERFEIKTEQYFFLPGDKEEGAAGSPDSIILSVDSRRPYKC